MPNLTDRLIEAARERLQEFDIALEMERPEPGALTATSDAGADGVATLSRGTTEARYTAVLKSSMTLTALARGISAFSPPPLVIGTHISRRSAAAFRTAGIQFVDTLGNASLKFGDVLIEVQGRTESSARQDSGIDPAARRSRSTNLFSPRRAQVILALLTWPELQRATIRDIADAGGVSAGQAYDALDQLEQAGFALPAPRRLVRMDELLDYWTAAYPAGLGSKLDIAKFHGEPAKAIRKPDSSSPAYLSGESAKGTDIARPATLTLYVDAMHPRLPIENRWSTNPDQTPNVFVRRKFWSAPHGDDKDPPFKTHNAPWPLVYADLVATGDARLREVARTWRAHCARPDDV